MQSIRGVRLRRRLAVPLALALLGVAAWGTLSARAATTFNVQAGAETPDKTVQVNDFLPGTVTVNVGDTVSWKVASTEFHTVTFLGGAPMPAFVTVGPQGPMINPAAAFPAGGSGYDGSGVANSGLLELNGVYSLTFTKSGAYHYVCIVHPFMQGDVMVKAAGEPADKQAALDAWGMAQLKAVLADQAVAALSNSITMEKPEGAIGVEAGNGAKNVMVMRFAPTNVTVHAGDQVTWINRDPGAPHTVTFLGGAEEPAMVVPEPQPNGPPMLLVNPEVLMPAGHPEDYNGGFLNSGFIGAPPDSPTDTFTVHFSAPGTYDYLCLLHDEMGMKGAVTVLP